MKLTAVFFFFLISISAYTQKSIVVPRIEPCDCPVKVDSSFRSYCAYLIVPENRKKNNGKTVKLPFVVVESKNPDKRKDPILFTGGGPGNSSLAWASNITRGDWISNRDCIAFEQRGTRFAIPYLRRFDLDTAIKQAYRNNLSKDSMILEGVKRYRKKLLSDGIDLAGYNTDETVADIHDLLRILQLDSVNLLGGSYSGGLMLAVLQKDASRIRSLVLDSPLPTFIPIDEQEPANFMHALRGLFERCRQDSTDKIRYGNMEVEFLKYFNNIKNDGFYFSYLEKGTRDSLRVRYSKNELLDVIVHHLQDASQIRHVPFMISEIIRGHHEPYIKERLDNVFLRNQAPDGMRISVYCADQAAYNDLQKLKQLYGLYPFLEGFRINDVYKAMCDCWNVPPIQRSTKQPFYHSIPVLIGDGEFDPACSPLYIDILHHYLPNSQRFLFRNRSHGAFGWEEGRKIVKQFLDNPYQKIISTRPDIIGY